MEGESSCSSANLVCKLLVGLLVCKGAADLCAYNNVVICCSATNVYVSVSANKNPTVLIARFSHLNELKEFERCLCILSAERRLLKKKL